MNRKSSCPTQAFGLAELMISMVLSSLVLLAGYHLLTSTSRKSTEIARETKSTLRSQKLLERLADEINNIVVIPDASGGSVLSNSAPPSCGFPDVIASIVPYPGHWAGLLNSTPLDPIDPSDTSWIAETGNKANDAIRMVYLTQDSEPLFLATDATEKQIPVSNDAEPIVLESSSEGKLRIGEYILLSDPAKSDLARITGISSSSNGLELAHSSSVSIWNQPTLSGTYGASSPDEPQAFVQKVGIKTYAYAPYYKALFVDLHQFDDGFKPVAGIFSGGPLLRHSWVHAASKISKFQVYYFVEGSDEPTRTPRAAPIGTLDPNCSNQLGNPDLRRIMVTLWDEEGKSERLINPENLRRGLSNVSQSENLARDPVLILGALETPTPTPTGTPTSGGGDPDFGGGGF